MTRGIRNNNPLNIRRNPANNWVGALSIREQTDREFEQFYSMYYGFRAALIIIGNYISRGCNTIEDIVTRWAPSSDVSCCKECAVHIKAAEHPPLQSTQACIGCSKRNNPQKYIRDVCRMTGIGGREPLPLPSASEHSGKYEDERLKNIVAAMAVIESGPTIRDYLIGLNKAFTDYVDRLRGA